MKSIKVCEYSRSRSFHDDLILQDQASGERYQTNGPLVFVYVFCLCTFRSVGLFVGISVLYNHAPYILLI